MEILSKKDSIFKFNVDLICYDKKLEISRMVKFKELYYNDKLLVGFASFNKNIDKFYELKLIENSLYYYGPNYKSTLYVVIRKIISEQKDYIPLLIEGTK